MPLPEDVDRLAELLHDVLRQAGPDALVSGEPLDAAYADGRLIDGVLIDGLFDLRRAAELLSSALEKPRTPAG